MDKLQKGFTLIELLISIVLLSLITIITTSILQNSIIQRNLYMENSNYLEKYNSFFGVYPFATIDLYSEITSSFRLIRMVICFSLGPATLISSNTRKV